MSDLDETRDGFSFRGGHVALDLCATVTGRLKAQPRDLLARPRDLGRWLKVAGLARVAPAAKEEDLTLARDMREAIFTLALARIECRGLPSEARSTLNALARGPGAILRLAEDGEMHLSGNVRALLATVAQEAVRLLGGVEADRIRQCDSESCSRLFVDTSRGGDRRWCSMSPCGNRAKVAEFRRRKRAAS